MKVKPITEADIARAASDAEFMTWPVLRAFLHQVFGRCPGQSTIYRWQNAANNPFPKARRAPGGMYFSRKEVRRWIAAQPTCA